MRRLFLAALLTCSLGTPLVAAGGNSGNDGNNNRGTGRDDRDRNARNQPDKVDRALAGKLKGGAGKFTVIITVKPGYRGSIRKVLELKGNKIKREHGSLNVFVAELDRATILELAKNPRVQALSLDGPIHASQLAPVVTVSPATVRPGGVVTVTIAGAPGNVNDWIALVGAGSLDSGYVAWQYLNGALYLPVAGLTTATLQFVAPMTLGPYNFRLFANGWTKLATSNTVTVEIPIPTLTMLTPTVQPGSAIRVAVSNGPGYRNDWVGLAAANAPNSSYVAWKYLNGAAYLPATGLTSATLEFVAPLVPGTYNLRFFVNGGQTPIATSTSVTVQTEIPATLTMVTPAVNPGSPITVTLANGLGLRSDWVTLGDASAPDSTYLAWQYLNGTAYLPATGLTSATLQFVAPMAEGTYTVRLFANGGWTKLATSSPVTVQGLPTATTTLRKTLGLSAVAEEQTLRGAGIGVAIIDSGLTPTADFADRITGFYDFTNGRHGVSVTPYDDYGHGTHVAGLVGSSGALSDYGFQGVAPAVRFIGLKVLDRTGAGNTSDVIAALQFVTANKAALGVHIVNMSLGHPIWAPAADDPLVQAVQHATAAGLIVVTSAGNVGKGQMTGLSGYAGITSPCNAPSAICIGAVNTHNTVVRGDDEIAAYSSKGPTWYDGYAKPDLIAPGHKLASSTDVRSYLYQSLPASQHQASNGQRLLALSGTSMAAGVTSGVVALVLDAHNTNGLSQEVPLTANAVKAILQYSAIPLAGTDLLTQGAGVINAEGAMALARSIDTSVPVDSWWLTQGVTPATVIGDETAAWAQNIVWGETVYGGDVVYRNNIVWGDNIIWGSTLIAGANIVWGESVVTKATNIVWGENIIWGENIVWGDRLMGQRLSGDNILWGDNIVWGENIVWAELAAQNAVWGAKVDSTRVVWGTSFGSSIIWGETSNITWGENASIIRGENLIWGENIIWGQNIVWGESISFAESIIIGGEAGEDLQPVTEHLVVDTLPVMDARPVMEVLPDMDLPPDVDVGPPAQPMDDNGIPVALIGGSF